MLFFMSSDFHWSWLKHSEIAIGSHPMDEKDWIQLRQAGITGVFNCCSSNEDQNLPTFPASWGWHSIRCPLPDHRVKQNLEQKLLIEALEMLSDLYVSTSSIYIHCWAGQERSVLMGIGLLSLQDDMSIFESLDYVKRMHRPAKPLFSQLALLENVISGSYVREVID